MVEVGVGLAVVAVVPPLPQVLLGVPDGDGPGGDTDLPHIAVALQHRALAVGLVQGALNGVEPLDGVVVDEELLVGLGVDEVVGHG